MPNLITQKYHFGGWQTVLLYSEAEMAAALGITRRELRRLIRRGQLAYHIHPQADSERQYRFTAAIYYTNLKRYPAAP